MTRAPKVRAASVLRHGALLLTGTAVLLPFAVMVSMSLKSPGECFQRGFSLLPAHWYATRNYAEALTEQPLLLYLLNGLLVCGMIVAIQLLVCVPAAYALAKLRFKGKRLIFAVVLVAMLVPNQVLAMPLYILCYQLRILDTYAAQILPFIVSPFGIYLFRQFFRSVPDDTIHAARLDGLSELSIVWRIMAPAALPALLAFSIFSIVGHWNDLFWPLIVIRSQERMPPALGIVAFRNDEAGNDYGPMMAAATIVVLPLIVAFMGAQRRFIDGFIATGRR